MSHSLRHQMIEAVAHLGLSPQTSEHAVDVVLSALKLPDAHMITGGLEELDQALGPHPDKEHGHHYRRQLVTVIWHAILDRAW